MSLDIEAIKASATNATYLGGEAQEQADNVLALIAEVERLQGSEGFLLDESEQMLAENVRLGNEVERLQAQIQSAREAHFRADCSWCDTRSNCPTLEALGVSNDPN